MTAQQGPNTPNSITDNPVMPQLYMYLYRQRKGKKALSSHSKKVVRGVGEGPPGRGGRK
jgi:hypothetical protein